MLLEPLRVAGAPDFVLDATFGFGRIEDDDSSDFSCPRPEGWDVELVFVVDFALDEVVGRR